MGSSKGKSLFLSFAKLVYSLTQAKPEVSSEGSTITDWNILPTEPYVGDMLTIKGRTEPDKSIDVSVSFSRTVKVYNGRYEYGFNDIRIPKGKNRFSVRSSPVKNLNFIVRMFIDFKRSFDSNKGVAEFAEDNVPPGTYDIVINGEAMEGAEEVCIDFTALETMKSDSEGYFDHKYETNALPEGDFTVSTGNLEKKITLRQVT
ncbi:hypothetical protein [Methanolobus halotolerans]|uniref:Uncharacterized protein n=1 Tax=Methanolobus halotolerans TaxID=2052935 RepID=A0A4E0PXZ6_9EURY|nr:hypothetical protein [Methanolobus halotolerans]TGC09739.1 hypothetical protein CUN85_05095 [Methanolobus halotolerans]